MSKAIRWKEPYTLQEPWKQRRKTAAEAIHSEAEWEEQKRSILELRETNELKDVMEIMAGKGFIASEAQYKYHFKIWGSKKYLKHTYTDNQLRDIEQEVSGSGRKERKTTRSVNGGKSPSPNNGDHLSN